jgi:hypothetical protein
MRRGKALLIAALCSLLFGAVSLAPTQAQTGSDNDIEDVVDTLVAAWNSGDADAFGARFTDEGIVAFVISSGAPPEITAAEARGSLADSVGDPPIELRDVRDITVSGNVASAIIELNVGGSLEADHLEFTKVGNEWLVSDYASNVEQVPAPAGYETVSVDLVDYGFDFDESAFAPGDDLAITAKNVGKEGHELVLVKVPEDLDLEAALSSDQEPPVEFLGATQAPAPGSTAPTLLVDGLTAGRYAMVCFFQTADGTPHWQLGMLADFTVGETQATPTPTASATATPTSTATATPTSTAVHSGTPVPPKTGNGGMLGGESEGIATSLVAALGLAVVLGASATYVMRKRSN